MKKTSKLLTLAASLFLIGGAVACDNQSSSVGSLPESSASSIADSVVESTNTAGLDEAYDYLYQLYKDEAGAKTTSFKVVAQIEVGETLYPVTWKVNIKEGGIAEAVKVGATEGGFTTIEVTYNETVSTANTEFDLVATISDGTNEKTATFTGFNVPAFAYGTIAQWLNAKDTETPMAIQGVVTAVNKLDKAGSFTLTDATGSVFSYDSPSAQVNLGDEIVISSIYSDYNGFPQLKAPEVIKTVATDQLAKVADKLETIDINTISSSLASYVENPTSISTKYVKITGGYVVNDGGYAGLATEVGGSKCVNVYYHSSSTMLEDVNAKVDVIGVVRGVGSSYVTLQVQGYEVTEAPVVSEKIPEPAIVNTTIAELVTNKPTEKYKAIYTATGTWSEKDGGAGEYGNGFITDADGNQITVYGLASSKEAAGVTWDEVGGSYSYKNPKDFQTIGLANGDTVTLGMLYDNKYDNYVTWLISKTSAETDLAPVADTDYKLAINHLGVEKTLYATGEMSGYYGKTTTAFGAGKDFRVDVVDGGYHLYFLDGETKNYVTIVLSGTYVNFKYVTESPVVFAYDKDYNTLYTEIDGAKYFFGANGTFETVGAYSWDKISDNYPAYLIAKDSEDAVWAPSSNSVLNASEMKAGDYTEDLVWGEYTIKATAEKNVTVDGNNKTVQGVSYNQRLKLNGTGSADYRSIHFTLAEKSTLTVAAQSGSSSADRALTVFTADGTSVATNTVLGASAEAYDYVLEAGTYYLASEDSSINIYGISHATYVEPVAGELAVFEFGENGAAKHVDGSDLGASKTYYSGDYSLELTSLTKVYGPAFDATGNSCIKLGTGKLAGSLTFTAPEGVNYVVIKVAGYKANVGKYTINGGDTVSTTTLSDKGEYEEVRIDVTTNKTVKFATVSGGYRVMINSIAYLNA